MSDCFISKSVVDSDESKKTMTVSKCACYKHIITVNEYSDKFFIHLYVNL